MSIVSLRNHSTVFFQLVLSCIALYLCFRDVDLEIIASVHKSISFPILITALFIKTIGLVIREIRLWLILDKPKPRFSSTIYVGLAAGFFHTFLPFRGGDVLSIAMLHKYCGLSPSKSSVAVGICAFFEMFVFGLFFLGILLMTPLWYDILGEQIYTQSFWSTSYIMLGCIGIVIIAGIIGKRSEPEANNEVSPIREFIQQLFSETHKAIAQKKVIIQLTISSLEILLMLFSFVLGLWAIGINPIAPWGTVCIVLAFSAVAAVALPPSYGAGPAAAILFVFSLLEIQDESALSYAAIWWILSQVPTLITGVPSLWLIKKES
ncbi:MAG: hypothetical protein CL916_06120 [Deltaproteobacteria bacterium]|nr:hypothetical protein [Deltaproteobacteria bacterium]